MLNISVIICAYNRAEYVKTILDCFLIQEVGTRCAYEIIVADNNSSDNTRDVVESYIPKFSGLLRYLFEPRQGKPYALNLAIKEARGEILAFTDDDCLVEKDYIARIHKVFQEYGAGIDFIGGKVFPHWVGGSCPDWLKEVLLDEKEYASNDERYWRRIFFRGPWGILDYGNEPFRVDNTVKMFESFLFYGPNMAVRKSAFDKIGGYAPDRNITQDTEICLRLIGDGMKGLYTPDIKVWHRVKVERMTPKFYFRWYYRRGQYLGKSGNIQRKFYHPLGIQNELIVKTVNLFLKSLRARPILDKIHYRCQALFNFGHMLQIAKKNIV